MTRDPPRSVVIALLVFFLLLSAALRFYRLDAQSFWNDEGNAVRAAQRSIPLILQAARGDIHPPGYYVLLHFWRALVGESEFALRSLSAFFGVLMVAFTYSLGRRVLGTVAGLGGAFLAALSPLAIYYSQEARMYALLGLISAASTTLLWDVRHAIGLKRLSRNAYPLSLLAYVVTAAVGLYTHYAFPFVLAVHNLLFVGWWGLQGRRQRGGGWLCLGWAGLQVLVLLPFLPWLPTALRSVAGWPSAGRGYDVGLALLDVFRALVAGITLETGQALPALFVAGGLFLAGLWPVASSAGGRRRDWALAAGALTLWLLLPIVLILAFDLYKPEYLKFLLAVLPPFHLLVAHGACCLSLLTKRLPLASRPLFLAGLSLLLLVAWLFPSLCNLYFNPDYARDNYRQIAAELASRNRLGDAILLNAPNQWEVFTYYFRQSVPVYPAPYHPTPGEIVAWLEPIRSSHRRLFVLYWGDREADPDRLVEGWLVAHAYPADSRWYGRVRLTTYGLGPLPERPAVSLDARFGQAIHLLGYAQGQGPFVPGDVVPVTLLWQTDAPVSERYKVFLHLLDAGGNLVAQNDSEPIGNLIPTTLWTPGEVVIDRRGVLLPADLPPGTYTLATGLYHLVSEERLPVTWTEGPSADSLLLGSVTVLP